MPLTVTLFPPEKGMLSFPGKSPLPSVWLAQLLSPTLLPAVIKFLRLTDGRDKSMKLVQYTLKLLLMRYLLAPQHKGLRTHLSALVSSFSTTRKITRLAHAIEPINELHSISLEGVPKGLSGYPLFRWQLGVFSTLLGVGNDLLDDMYCLAKIKVLPAHIGDWAERRSLYCWFSSICIDVHENIAQQRALARKIPLLPEEEQGAAAEKLYWVRLSLFKLLADGFFCSYDLSRATWSDEAYVGAGWLSGVLGTYKLWVKTNP
jgi:hypothetical protein